MKLSGIFLIILSMLAISCGDSKEYKTAKDFVNALNYDLNYDVELIKTVTKQEDYILVYDYDLQSYDAYNISNYTRGEDVGVFLDQNESTFYYDLDYAFLDVDYYYVNDTYSYYDYSSGQYVTIYDGRYEPSYEDVYIHRPSGLYFSKQSMTASDTVKSQELIDGIKVKKATQQLTVQFGLPPARAKEVAGLAMQLNNADQTTMTTYQYNQYSKAILGSTYTDIQAAINNYVSGDEGALENVYAKAAKTNGVSKNQVKKLAELFIKN